LEVSKENIFIRITGNVQKKNSSEEKKLMMNNLYILLFAPENKRIDSFHLKQQPTLIFFKF